MSIDHISEATFFDGDQGFMQTNEVHLLTDGDIKILSCVDDKIKPIVNAFIGDKNTRTFNAKTNKFTAEKEPTLTETSRYVADLLQWRSLLLGRELAVRSIESCVVADVSPSRITAGIERSVFSADYDHSSRIRSNKPNIPRMTRSVEDALHNGESLGDAITQMRLAKESVAMIYLTKAMRVITESDPLINSQIDGYKQRERVKKMAILHHELKNRTGLRSRDVAFLINKTKFDLVSETRLNDESSECYGAVSKFADMFEDIRGQHYALALSTDPDTPYIYVPENFDIYQPGVDNKAGHIDDQRESIQIQPMTEEQRAAAAENALKMRAQYELERQDAIKQEEAQREIDAEHDAPILEHLNELAHEFNGIIDQYTAQTKRSLRDIGIFGKDSLDYWLQQSKCIDGTEVDHLVRVYARMNELAEEDDEKMVELLTQDLLRIEELKAEYATYRNEHALHGIEKPVKLQEDIKKQLELLAAEWAEFRRMIQASAHSNYTTPARLQAVAAMLGIEMPANETNKIEDEAPEEVSDNHASDVRATISPLQQANRLAEQLNWVVLPDEKITVDELVDIAEETIRRKSADKNPAVVERYRMEALLTIKEQFNGTLYRSDERTLGDGDNLYFVVRFQHPGDDNFYAVAENPVYGNATYVIREDTLPLQPGETALAAVRLSRREVQYFGAKRIIHGTPDLEVHLEKISEHIAKLSEHESVFAH